MKQLKYYLAGIISVLFVLPILNKFMDVILLKIETLLIKPSMKILNYHKDTTILREFTKQAEPTQDYEVEYIYIDDDDDFEDFDDD